MDIFLTLIQLLLLLVTKAAIRGGYRMFYRGSLTLVMMGGGASCAPHSLFIFLLKIIPPDQTLRPTCKYLILGIFYHAIFFGKFSI